MLSRVLDDIFGPHSKISVLRVLFFQDNLSGREVARRAGLSPRAASLSLAQLSQTGIVRKRESGAAHRFTINRERYLVHTVLEKLFAEEERLADAIGRRLLAMSGRNKCVSIAIFGSYARGEGAFRSDLDVLFLLNDPDRVREVKDALHRRGEKFFALFGLRLAPYVVGAGEFVGRLKKGDALMRAMIREARVIAGKPLAEVMVDESKEEKN